MQDEILTFEQQGALDVARVGGKGHGLAVMAQAGIPVAPGFIITTSVHQAYLRQTGLERRLNEALASMDRDSLVARETLEREVAAWFDGTRMPPDLRDVVCQGYAELARALQLPDLAVAVRSSATAEDTADTSFAGEYETYVGMRGADAMEQHIRRCWASVFSARAVAYAWKHGIDPLAVHMAVVVQKVVDARAAGVMFTVSPTTGDRSRIVIEASYGLGLGVVGGDVTPDRYVVAKVEGYIVERILGDKHLEYGPDGLATPVDRARRDEFCLSDAEAINLAKMGKRLERMHNAPQDIEFAIDRGLPADDNLVLLQCRPVTVKLPGGAAADDVISRLTASVLSAVR
ncbi:PEP/pyruvate-binding domain-containing protein [Eoetvoesiella caeni]|uniref:Phosphoenolpyruvate synthase n=1 Tax=Eoetvoesiella caeni TaxID=645616 RepID=A0A366HAW1_9BURK|nr:PEP/pyruvate-binding domain-containing protein [Eoetvoesiella caeni]MCI2809605.1 PEP/pyruvate-binding domain-containing protein [Eoetvoesiella caeni]NYT56101.1 PEP/pyruvate-binding domain-containing protein [Eoetvoesiella caeni]RBP38866.1 pyruvate,water dikinase [Eoetvoesiella caeni]